MPYGEDSLFTLGPAQVAGVLALSALLAAVALWGVGRARRRGQVAALAVAVVLFWAFDWLSPQAYYAYYRAIIDGLPAQWVVGWPPPGLGRVLRLLTFTGPADLSTHGRGLLGWALLARAAWPPPRPPRG